MKAPQNNGNACWKCGKDDEVYAEEETTLDDGTVVYSLWCKRCDTYWNDTL